MHPIALVTKGVIFGVSAFTGLGAYHITNKILEPKVEAARRVETPDSESSILKKSEALFHNGAIQLGLIGLGLVASMYAEAAMKSTLDDWAEPLLTYGDDSDDE